MFGLITPKSNGHHASDQDQSGLSARSNKSASSVNGTTRTARDSIREEKLVKRSRKTLHNYLHRVGEATGRPLKLNLDTGTCSFSYQRFIVVIESPSDQPDIVYFYTCVCRVENEHDNVSQVMQTSMELNYLQDRTRGASLGFKQAEVNLCRLVPLSTLNADKLRKVLDEFLVTATECNAQLERAKRVSEPMSSPHHQDYRGLYLERRPSAGASPSSQLSRPKAISPRARTYTK